MLKLLLLAFHVMHSDKVTCQNTDNEDKKTIAVIDKGILPVSKKDIGLSFYVNVENQYGEEVSLSTKMLVCCELITEDDNDCNHMHLVGGQMGTLAPGQRRKITLIYVTLYPYNRKGRCGIAIYYKGSRNKMGIAVKTEILFDTLITNDVAPEALRGFYDPATVTLCDSPDQDPLNHCKPVNCHWKYGGTRSFYNEVHKRCEKVPICTTNLENELPDIVYVPNINQCKDLSVPINEEDVKHLTRMECDNTRFTAPDQPMITNIECHHGHVNLGTGFCECDPGWTSSPPGGEDFTPSTLPYHMCTLRSSAQFTECTAHAQTEDSPVSNLISTVTCLVTAIMVILFSIVTHDCWIYQEKSRASGRRKKNHHVQFALSKNCVY
ncbi:hypothetical protein WDU94_014490 [Cyamophila willieti]